MQCYCFRCDLAQRILWEQIELEDALHWLSTLGGAYSNLGDHSLTFVSLLSCHLETKYMDFFFRPKELVTMPSDK